MLLLMLCSIVVPWCTSSVSTVPQLNWTRMHLRRQNTLYMYVIGVGKCGRIMAHRCRVIHLHHFSCSWFVVACCLVSGSLLCCRLLQHCSMHVAIKQLMVNQPLPLSYTQEMFRILHNQNHFLLLLVLQLTPLGVTQLILEIITCRTTWVWMTLFPALCGCMAIYPG